MFEQLLTGRIRKVDPREAVVALISILFHAAGIVLLLAASYLYLTPMPLPRLRPVLIGTAVFPRAEAPAPKLGASPAAVPSANSQTKRSRSSEEMTQMVQPANPHEEKTSDDGSASVHSAGDPGPTPGDFPGPFSPGIDPITDPVIIESSKVLPKYPDFARRVGVEGQATLRAAIGIDGSVGSVVVLRETPTRVGFGDAAVEAVSRWSYHPGMLRGEPVPAEITITVTFALSS